MDEFIRCFTPKTISGACRDYRAGAPINFEMDTADKDKKIATPRLVLWGTRGVPPTDEYPTVWRKFASNLETIEPLATGHYIQEEMPEQCLDRFFKFFVAWVRKMAQFVLLDACMALAKKGADPFKISEAYLAVSVSGKYSSLMDEAPEEIIKLSRAEPIQVYEFLIGVADSQRRQLNFLYGRVTRKAWDGAVAGDKLFSGEHIPGDPTVYLDQRYIDFLARNCNLGFVHDDSPCRPAL